MLKKPSRTLAPLALAFAVAAAAGATMASDYLGKRETARIEALTLAAAPPYEPRRWNADEAVLKNNNCYAYAANDIDTAEYGAMPGKRTINQDPPYIHSSYWEWQGRLIRGAIADGMIHTGSKPAAKPGYYRVVLMMHPDYQGYGLPYHHWLRQGPDGFWSGKDGPTLATDLDRTGRRIHDPEMAVLGFNQSRAHTVAYFLVPQGGLDVGNPNEPKTHRASRVAYKAPPAQPPIIVAQEIVVTAPRHAVR